MKKNRLIKELLATKSLLLTKKKKKVCPREKIIYNQFQIYSRFYYLIKITSKLNYSKPKIYVGNMTEKPTVRRKSG